MKVLGFKAFYHHRIVMQVQEGFGGQDFAAYVGVIMDDAVSHRQYEPVEAGGHGVNIPNAVKMSYADTRVNFGHLVDKLEAQGKHWRR